MAWWGIYTGALKTLGWTSTGSSFRIDTTGKGELTIDAAALKAITGLVGMDKLGAIRSVLEALRAAPEDDRRITLLDRFGSEKKGGIFQLGLAEGGADHATLTLGAVHYRNTEERKRILFIDWGGETSQLWVAAEQLTLNLDFYEDAARDIVEEKLRADAAGLIMAIAEADLAPA